MSHKLKLTREVLPASLPLYVYKLMTIIGAFVLAVQLAAMWLEWMDQPELVPTAPDMQITESVEPVSLWPDGLTLRDSSISLAAPIMTFSNTNDNLIVHGQILRK